MKCEIEPIAECAFSPVVIKLTLESKEELQELWHRLNMGTESMEKICRDYKSDCDYNFHSSGVRFTEVWEALDDVMTNRSIKA